MYRVILAESDIIEAASRRDRGDHLVVAKVLVESVRAFRDSDAGKIQRGRRQPRNCEILHRTNRFWVAVVKRVSCLMSAGSRRMLEADGRPFQLQATSAILARPVLQRRTREIANENRDPWL